MHTMHKPSNSCPMLLLPAIRFLLCALASIMLALFAQCAAAQDSGAAALTPAGQEQTASIATIEAAQQNAQREIARIESQYTQDEQACRTQFFVNACRDSAKERRRTALQPAHRMQVEADTQMRRLHAAERDAALADRNRKQVLEATEMEQKAQIKAEENTRKQEYIAEKNQQLLQDGTPRLQPSAHRSPGHPQVDPAVDAQKRARNVAAYEKKIQDAEAHQRDLAARKAEKDRTRKKPAPADAQPLEPAPAAH